MSESSATESIIHDDNVLFMSDVLTRFHNDTYEDPSKEPTKPKGNSSSQQSIISPNDVISSAQYRNEVEEYRSMASDLEWAKRDVGVTVPRVQKILKSKCKDIWRNKQNRLGEGRFSTDEDTSDLLTKLEVWAAKEVVNEMLMNGNGAEQSNFSSVLSMPSGEYMSTIAPPCNFSDSLHKPRGLVRKRSEPSGNATTTTDGDSRNDTVNNKDSHYERNLAVTTNSFTWKQMLRLSSMISALPPQERQNVFVSPFTRIISANGSKVDCITRSSKKKAQTSELYLYSTRTAIQPPDLVALWIRAQRNTAALRHLNHLFVVKKVQTTIPSESDENENLSTESTKTQISHMATYSRNYSRLRDQVELESPLVEELIHWAMGNQVLFTYHHLRNSLSQENNGEASQNVSLKRNHVVQQEEDQPSKKSRTHSGDDKTPEKMLLLKRARQVYILRLFVWRNLDILNVLCYSKHLQWNEENGDNIVDKVTSDIAALNVPEKVKSYLKQLNDSTDRTFFRIDRRILIGKYEQDTFENYEQTVRNLLVAFKTSLPKDSPYLEKVTNAEADFESILLHINDTEDVDNTNSDTNSDEIRENLLQCPQPWHDKCISSNEEFKSGEEKIICWNCDVAIRKQSMKTDDKGEEKSTLLQIPLFTALYSASPSELPTKPDYINNPIEWSEHNFTLTRTRNNDKFQSWGMLPSNPGKSSEALNQLERLAHGSSLKPLNKEQLSSKIPMRIPHHWGIIVAMVNEGPAKISGLQEGDIIVEIAVPKDSDTQNIQNSFTTHDLTNSQLKWNDKKKLFKLSCSILKVKLLRPSKPIFEISQVYTEAVMKWQDDTNEEFNKIVKDSWYCPGCLESASVYDNDSNCESVKDQAMLCQTLVRRIGMEWHSLPFHEENADTDSGSSSIDDEFPGRFQHAQHVCLRRLDTMMDWIISGRYPSPSKNDEFDPFCVPPGSPCSGTRLDWVEEIKPYDILCRGIGLLTNPLYGHSSIAKFETRTFQKRFIELFTAWCGGGKRSPNKVKFQLPRFALQRFSPFIGKSSELHCTRPNEEIISNICDSDQFPNEKSTIISESDRMNQMVYSHELYRYDHYSSFIGTLLLVLPGDPLLSSLEKALAFTLDLMNRPCEILILSYIPRDFVSNEVRKKNRIVREKGYRNHTLEEREKDGLYYAVPILNHNQLNFLLSMCKMRDYKHGDKRWVNLDVLALDGVIEFTPSELSNRLKYSDSIQRAIDVAVLTTCIKGEESITYEKEQKIVRVSPSYNLLWIDLINADKLDPLSSGMIPNLISHQLFQIESCSSLVSILFENCDSALRQFFKNRLDVVDCNQDVVDDSYSAIDYGQEIGHKKLVLKSKRHQNENVNIMNLGDSNVSADIEFFHGLVYFQESDAAKKGICTVSYTDLLYWDKNSVGERDTPQNRQTNRIMNELQEKMSKQILNKPTHCKRGDIVAYTIVLHRFLDTSTDSIGQEFHGKGWGLELVRWVDEEHLLRVGRVVPNSPAETCGLKTHDIIHLVSGNSSNVIGFDGSLAGMLLGSISQISASENLSSASILHNLENAVTGPVVLCILRSTKDEKPISNDISQQTEQQQQPNSSHITNDRVSGKTTGQSNATLSPEVRALSEEQEVEVIEQPTASQPTTSEETRQPAQRQEASVSERTNNLAVQPQPQYDQNKQSILSFRHLYSPGLPDSFLSLAETAILIETLHRSQPCLAVRLLAPRYSSELLRKEYQSTVEPYVKQNGNYCVPKPSEDLYNFILNADYKRSLTETGPIIFEEKGFTYRMPVSKLPIDRLCDYFFERKRAGSSDSRSSSVQPSFLRDDQTTADMSTNSSSNVQQQNPSVRTHINNTNRPQNTNVTHNDGGNANSYTATNGAREEVHYPKTSANGHNTLPIRGGGDTDGPSTNKTDEHNLLSSLPADKWHGRAVYGKILISNSTNSNSISSFLGIVASQIFTSDINDQSDVPINIFFVNNSRTKIFLKEIPLDGLFLVPNVSTSADQMAIIDTWKNTLTSNNLSDTTKGVGMLQQEASKLFGQLQHYTSSRNLGQFPDGRTLHWFSTDPTALYIRTDPYSTSNLYTLQREFCYDVERNNNLMKSRKISKSLILSKDKKFYCPWGCTNPSSDVNRKSVLGFTSEKELIQHLREHHSFQQQSDDFKYRWERLSEGGRIIELATDISSAICARYYFLSKYSLGLNGASLGHEESFYKFPFEKRMLLDAERMVELVTSSNEHKVDLKKIGLLRETRELIRTFSKLSLLFKIDDSGEFRLRGSYIPEFSITNKASSSKQSTEEDLLSILTKQIESVDSEEGDWNDTHDYETIPLPLCSWLQCDAKFLSQKPDIDCMLCRTTNEVNVRSKVDDVDGDTFVKRHSIGGALLSDACFFQHEEQKKIVFQNFPIHRQLDAVKHLLLKVASNTPQSIRFIPIQQPPNSSLKYSIWEEEKLELWSSFVRRCISCRSMIQAYILLLSSIKKEKMPEWWKSEYCGWSSSFVIMQTPTLSNLALHLYALDAAMVEYLSTKPREIAPLETNTEPQSPTDDVEMSTESQHLSESTLTVESTTQSQTDDDDLMARHYKRYTFPERMRLITKRAAELGIDRREGDHDDECYVCAGEGDLLCCEFCTNVCHEQCTGYKGSFEEIDWVCNECERDILFVHEL